jgi:hypothetical protein
VGERGGAVGAERGDEAVAVTVEIATDGLLDVGVDVGSGQASRSAEFGDDKLAFDDRIEDLGPGGFDGLIELGVGLVAGADLPEDRVCLL